MRIALGAALFAKPDLLLLDEPTNHLDLEAVAWLESYLKHYQNTVLIISHDRHLLNNVVDRIFLVHHQKITLYNGNYDFYEKTCKEQLAVQEAALAKQQAQRAHIQHFIDRFRAKATKARQAQSRIKMLEKFEPIVIYRDDPSIVLNFPEPEQLPPPMVTMEKAKAGYGEKVVLKNLTQRIDPGDRIALLGANGNGKSTFAKLVAGFIDPLGGEVNRARKLQVGFFHQHQIDALRPDWSALDHLGEVLPNQKPEKLRAQLGRFGFSKEKAELPTEKLSGGEKARLNFAMISAQNPQLLILDEPTNHLDMDTRDNLIMALNDFEGAVILITHDWHLLEHTADKLWLVADQKVEAFDGALSDYIRQVVKGEGAEVLSKQKSSNRAQEIKAKKMAKKKKKK